MFPAERSTRPDSAKAKGKSEEKATQPKFMCPLCGSSGHTRIDCKQLNSDQKEQYRVRLEGVQRLTEEFNKMEPLPEPASASSADIAKAHRNTLAKVTDLVRETMQ